MSSVSLKLKGESSMFGTTVSILNKDKSYNKIVVENLDFNPLKNLKTSLKEGYLFRNPNLTDDVLETTLSSLRNVGGYYSFLIKMDKDTNKLYALIRFKEKNDAAVFAWTNVQNWQKWSDDLEEEEKKNSKERKKPLKAKVNKDGTVTVKVTVTTLQE